MKQKSDHPSTQGKSKNRGGRKYSAPQITRYGNLKEITAAANPGEGDATSLLQVAS